MEPMLSKCRHLNLKNLKKLAIDSNFAKNPNAILGGFIAKQNIMINAIYSIQ
jgi:hypothetical protein